METVYQILDQIAKFLPFIALIGIPYGLFGLLKMIIHGKKTVMLISLVSLGAFLVSRYLDTQIIPADIESFENFIRKDVNYFEISSLLIFIIAGSFVGAKKTCPNCKSIDGVKKLGKRLINSQSLGGHTAYNGPHSVSVGKVEETHETGYKCTKCNHTWTENSTSTRGNTKVNTYS